MVERDFYLPACSLLCKSQRKKNALLTLRSFEGGQVHLIPLLTFTVLWELWELSLLANKVGVVIPVQHSGLKGTMSTC